jgi:multiple sugar transport system substrate-binding protein
MKRAVIGAAVITTTIISAMMVKDDAAQRANEQFIPLLVYRTGPYAPTGIPFWNGLNDYFNLITLAKLLLSSILVLLLLTAAQAFAADLTIWWNKGYYPEEDEGIRRMVADFEKKTGTTAELDLFPQAETVTKLLAALAAGQPPDVVFAYSYGGHESRWAAEGLLMDLSEVVRPNESRYAPTVLDWVRHLNERTGERGYYGLPIAQVSWHIHVWKSLLDQAGIGLDQIPKEWNAFWEFWCDTVQSAVRRATGRANVFGLGLTMSTAATTDTARTFEMFLLAHDADFMGLDGRLLFDRPGMRERIIRTLESYTRPAKRGCNPPGAVAWNDADNNVNFLNQIVVMTVNGSLSIPSSQRTTNPDNYYKHIVTIEWPNAVDGSPITYRIAAVRAIAFQGSDNPAGAKAFLKYLSKPEHLGPVLDASQGRWYPPMPSLADRLFWTDPADPHRSALRRQLTQHPTTPPPEVYNWRYQLVQAEKVWPNAISRIVIDGWTPEAAADEAIARTIELMEQ